ncbi:hypothetical protein E8E14_003698 [Neopestalotiopsis sp. 37M]|nr:hypothetical protein E8E14_003698 [Neopestalotiopsis sp. 37M]
MPGLTNSLLSSSLISLRGLIPHDAAIINACKTGNSTKVEQLLTSRRARPNDATLDNSTALSERTRIYQLDDYRTFGTANDVYKLVDLGASSFADGYVTLWGRSPLHIAAIMDNVSTLQALTDMYIGDYNTNDGDTQQHAILETADINGWTPLHLAIYSRAMNTAKWLLSKKVDVHKITYRTAIWFPQNQTNATFSVMDVANMAGEKVLEVFPSLLVDAGYDITTDGSDIYW